MNYIFDYLVFIGRFQPFHLAHLQTIEIALQQSQNIILALGSAQNERNIKNPFSALEREKMILSNFAEIDQKRIKFIHVIDMYDDIKWQKLLSGLVNELIDPEAKVGLIGHFKDDSSYYLQLFPEWTLVELESLKNAMSATPVREAYYRGEIEEKNFPHGTLAFLKDFQKTEIYQQLRAKYLAQDKSSLNEHKV